jgi:two-component system LytT family response regulator
LRSHSKEHYIALDDIFYLEADGMYTKIHLEQEIITASKPLKAVLEELPKQFVRTHRSYAVNAVNVSKPLKIKNNLLALNNNAEVPISALKKKALVAALN